MLHSLFGDPTHVGEADALAEKFGPLWDKYVTPESGALALTGYAPAVRVGLGTSEAGQPLCPECGEPRSGALCESCGLFKPCSRCGSVDLR
jgi:hypothetical protein